MGKFNINQILSDASKSASRAAESTTGSRESELKKISVFDLVPSEENFYSMKEIEELKTAIEIAGKVLQNLTVVPIGNGKYKVISGHRRRLASMTLANEGKPQYEFVMCSVEPNEDDTEDQEIRDGLNLIVTNSQREKTAWDKIEEVRYLREVLERAKKTPRYAEHLQKIITASNPAGEIEADNTRSFIAKVLHISTTQVGRFDTIIRHLIPQFKEELRKDRINVSTAYELAGAPEDIQTAAFTEYQKTGEISIKQAKAVKNEAPPLPVPKPEPITRQSLQKGAEKTEITEPSPEAPSPSVEETASPVEEIKRTPTLPASITPVDNIAPGMTLEDAIEQLRKILNGYVVFRSDDSTHAEGMIRDIEALEYAILFLEEHTKQ